MKIVSIIKVKRVLVNYHKAVSLFIGYLTKKAVDADAHPSGICKGPWRLKPETWTEESSAQPLWPYSLLLGSWHLRQTWIRVLQESAVEPSCSARGLAIVT